MRKKTPYRCLLLLPVVLALLLGCAGKGKDLKTIQEDPETLYKKGLARYNKRDYPEALEIFEQLKSSFPDSPPYTLWAELKSGDCHFFKEEYVEAVAAYEEFKKIHPTYDEIPYVQYQIGMAYYNQMLSLDRDQTPTKKALSSFEYLIANYPSNLFTERAKEKARLCKERLADHEFYVGNFYYKHGRFEAASVRFEGLIGRYPKMPEEDRSLYLLGKSCLEIDRKGKAREAFSRLINEYPKSSYGDEAKAILDQGIDEGSPPKTKKVEETVKPENEEIYLPKFDEERRQPRSFKESGPEVRAARLPSPAPQADERVRTEGETSLSFLSLKPEEEKRKEILPPPLPFETRAKIEVKPAEEKHNPGLPSEISPEETVQRGVIPQPEEGKETESGLPIEKGSPAERSQPIDITSDNVETYYKENLILFKGNVMARQKDIVIYADSLETVIIEDGKGIEKVVAGGNVKIQQGTRLANCQKAVFYNLDRRIVLTGDPKVVEGDNMVQGEEIVFHIDKNRIEVKGGKTGRGKVRIFEEGELKKLE